MVERSNNYVFTAETADEQLALNSMLDMWAEVAAGRLSMYDTPEIALKISAERNVPVVAVQSYMRRAKTVCQAYQVTE